MPSLVTLLLLRKKYSARALFSNVIFSKVINVIILKWRLWDASVHAKTPLVHARRVTKLLTRCSSFPQKLTISVNRFECLGLIYRICYTKTFLQTVSLLW